MSTELTLFAPFDGIVVPMAQVPDAVFSGLMMGDGLAIEPLSPTLMAPCDGVITQLARTNHSLTLQTSGGAEIFIHCGIDTVNLKGEGFTALVKVGQQVKSRQALINIDLDVVAQKVPSLQTMIIITNQDQFDVTFRASGTVLAGTTPFLTIVPSNAETSSASKTGAVQRGTATVRHSGGVHARPAAKIQNVAKQFVSDIHIAFKGQQANAKSVVALMSLGVSEDDEVEVITQGDDAINALQAVTKELETGTAYALETTPQTQSNSAAPGQYRGVCAAPGLAIGQIVRLDRDEMPVPEWATNSKEHQLLEQALQSVRDSISKSVITASQHNNTAASDIFTAHLALLEDTEILTATDKLLTKGHSAGFSFREAIREQCKALLNNGNPLLAARTADLMDIERQVLCALYGEQISTPEMYAESILLADDLVPSQLTQLPRDQIVGVITSLGGASSHVAILARALGIPALVACGPDALQMPQGQWVLLDSSQGQYTPEPSENALSDARQKIVQMKERRDAMFAASHGDAITLDGIAIDVAANIANQQDAQDSVNFGANGVGLLRTEFLFIDRNTAPSDVEQAQAYQSVLDTLNGKSAIIRTLDIGGDKLVPYMALPKEPNPALGLRGIRTSFAYPAMLDDQLRGLLSVQPLSRLRIMVPMISEVDELITLRTRIKQLANEMGLSELPQIGVMIEVPSAALLADQLAKEADFLSIGTNDLTQYVLAMDRCNANVASSIDSLHPSVLRMISVTVEGARKHKKWVGVCGAMASDLEAVPVLIGLGITELSVVPRLVPEIKNRVRTLDQNSCADHAKELLTLTSAKAVRQRLNELWPSPETDKQHSTI